MEKTWFYPVSYTHLDVYKRQILKLAKKEDLTYEMAEAVMNEIMSGEATPVQMSAYLTALSIKGETIDEITASAAGMRAHCIKLLHNMDAVSYTHLDVYKRQAPGSLSVMQRCTALHLRFIRHVRTLRFNLYKNMIK